MKPFVQHPKERTRIGQSIPENTLPPCTNAELIKNGVCGVVRPQDVMRCRQCLIPVDFLGKVIDYTFTLIVAIF